MPTWTHSPPADPRGQGLPLIRTPAQRPLRAIVTCENLIGTDTHFWGGHTVPCERPDCEACGNGIRFDWHGYLSAYNHQDQLHFIFEMTANAAGVFKDYFLVNKTLRCCEFEAYRWNHRKNGRVIIKCQLSGLPSHALPRAPNVQKIMAIIWRLPIPNVKVDGIERGHPKVHASSEHNGQSSDPKNYSKPNP